MKVIQNEDHYKFVIEEGINLAARSIWIATANLKDMQIAMCKGRYRSIVEHLNDLAKNGIEIKLLYGGDPSIRFKKSYLMSDIHKGFSLLRCSRVHMKTIIIDGSCMYLGSANLTGAGEGVKKENLRNFEMGIITKDINEIDKAQSLFNMIWEGAFCKECGRRKICKKPIDSTR